MIADWLALAQDWRWDLAGRLALAVLLGGLIGFEREWSGHSAGLRTNILVMLGACLFTVLSIEAFPLRGTAQDTARIAAQIVSGIGFLGAGVMFQDKSRVRGLTTAATIWLVAAIGMAVGAGSYFLAIFSTLLAVAVLVLLRPLGDWLSRHRRRRADAPESVAPDTRRTIKRRPRPPR
jgi:putative Mg2+ transporter-C (MgtC) family protein